MFTVPRTYIWGYMCQIANKKIEFRLCESTVQPCDTQLSLLELFYACEVGSVSGGRIFKTFAPPFIIFS